ncbi:MAG: tRNA-guanine transglycosylase, partial [Candidatus Falkowbacteria bacterium]
KWAKRCRREYDKQIKLLKNSKTRPLLFAVIQGGNNLELRRRSSRELIKIGFDGFGFGARHIDESGNFLTRAIKYTADQIPENKLRFGLGIGRPEDIIKSVKLGYDMFDCVIPTREGRHGKLFFQKRKSKPNADNFYNTINITNAKFAKDFSPINEFSGLVELRQYSKAFLNYLFKIKEPLALRLASLNNLEFYLNIISEVKELIKKNKI